MRRMRPTTLAESCAACVSILSAPMAERRNSCITFPWTRQTKPLSSIRVFWIGSDSTDRPRLCSSQRRTCCMIINSKRSAIILATADFVIQDDTGIPFRFLNQPPWHVKLYGRYNKPTMKGLRYGYQPDLEAAYKAKPDLAELPFPFGYHWRGRQSGLIMANR